MKGTFIFVFSLLLPSCAQPHPNHINPIFAPIYIQFQHDAAAIGVHFDADRSLTIQFANLGYNPKTTGAEIVGECQSQSDNRGYNNTISIDPVFWDNATVDEQWLLVYHELGHCVLGAGHTANPDDIMYPDIGVNISVWHNEHWKSIDGLFRSYEGRLL